ERSERLHEIEEAIASSRRACLECGDGLDLARLEAEVAAEDVSAIPARLAEIGETLAGLHEQQTERTRILAESEAELRRYAGQADAASAEARRQEALAAMSGAVE